MMVMGMEVFEGRVLLRAPYFWLASGGRRDYQSQHSYGWRLLSAPVPRPAMMSLSTTKSQVLTRSKVGRGNNKANYPHPQFTALPIETLQPPIPLPTHTHAQICTCDKIKACRVSAAACFWASVGRCRGLAPSASVAKPTRAKEHRRKPLG